MTISIQVRVGDLVELVGKKLISVEGDSGSLELKFEGGVVLNIFGNDGYDFPAPLDFELTYAHSNDC